MSSSKYKTNGRQGAGFCVCGFFFFFFKIFAHSHSRVQIAKTDECPVRVLLKPELADVSRGVCWAVGCSLCTALQDWMAADS